ncbi:hypothetical protein BU15DRAFT_75700 [Melanogaster broomeanus]|nr:hypothetical protein BU15DRAFT_75700 [Melanogaster broomeanus]
MNRPLKMKPRRISRSRDPNSTRRPPVASPYPQRNRSTSRKRGHDEREGVPGSSMGAYSTVFSSPQSIGGKSSPHSSPASVDLPSPSMSTMETTQQQEGSPRLMGAAPYNYTGTPLSPLHVPSPYDYGMHHSPLASAGGHQWETSPGEHAADMYASGSQPSTLPYATYEQHSNMDPSWYNGSSDTGYTSLSTTPPTSSFSAPGLPFLGLDYIRNYNSNGYSVGGGQDSLWQTFDAGAFGLDPELPFTLGEVIPEPREGQQSPSRSRP